MSSEFDRGVKAARDVVMAKCWDFQEDMKHSDGASSYTRDGEEITQGLYWDIDALLSKACCVPPSGWRCTRTAGHEGPCAAVPIEDGFPASPNPADYRAARSKSHRLQAESYRLYAQAERLCAAGTQHAETIASCEESAKQHERLAGEYDRMAENLETELTATARRASALAALENQP